MREARVTNPPSPQGLAQLPRDGPGRPQFPGPYLSSSLSWPAPMPNTDRARLKRATPKGSEVLRWGLASRKSRGAGDNGCERVSLGKICHEGEKAETPPTGWSSLQSREEGEMGRAGGDFSLRPSWDGGGGGPRTEGESQVKGASLRGGVACLHSPKSRGKGWGGQGEPRSPRGPGCGAPALWPSRDLSTEHDPARTPTFCCGLRWTAVLGQGHLNGFPPLVPSPHQGSFLLFPRGRFSTGEALGRCTPKLCSFPSPLSPWQRGWWVLGHSLPSS